MIKELARQVALYLGESYYYDPSKEGGMYGVGYNEAAISCKDQDNQFTIVLGLSTKEKKVIVDGALPRAGDGSTFPYEHERHDLKIRMTDRKNARQIADEILRRFLPLYLADFTHGVVRRDSRNAYNATTAGIVARFAKMLEADECGENVKYPKVKLKDGGSIRRFQVSGDSIHVEFAGLKADMVEKMLELWVDRKETEQVKALVEGYKD